MDEERVKNSYARCLSLCIGVILWRCEKKKMTNKEWLNKKKELCENGIEFSCNRIKEFERELEVIKNLISLAEGQPADDETAQ